jgi:hypothetical protein
MATTLWPCLVLQLDPSRPTGFELLNGRSNIDDVSIPGIGINYKWQFDRPCDPSNVR